GELARWQAEVRAVSVDASLQAYIVAVAAATRQHPRIALGVSPRGSLAWLRVAQALAWMDGRGYVKPDDMREAALPVLAHRVMLANPSALSVRREVMASVLAEIAVPD